MSEFDRRWGVILGTLIFLFVLQKESIKLHANDSPVCSSTPIASVSQLLNRVDKSQWMIDLRQLTGEDLIQIEGSDRRITTRYTPHLFDGSIDGMAFQFIENELSSMQYPMTSRVDHYGYFEEVYSYQGKSFKNLILNIPGRELVNPSEVIISAHLDDLPGELAPGADNNGVGVAAMLEIARVLRYYRFDATIRLVWFTGEEQGLLGSTAFLLNRPLLNETLIGDINLDSFGYDHDGDGCFEIQAGVLPESSSIAECLSETISAYSLPLKMDLLNTESTGWVSAHNGFWAFNLPAIGIEQNHSARDEGASIQECEDLMDVNPYLHTSEDKLEWINVDHAFQIMKAGLATAAVLSQPGESCFEDQPTLSGQMVWPYIHLIWQEISEGATYRIYRSTTGCQGSWELQADSISGTEYYDYRISSPILVYQVEAVDPSGQCISLPSNCVWILNNRLYFPVVGQ